MPNKLSWALPFSLYTPGLMDDPYRPYAALRDAPPVFWSDEAQSWIVHRYADAMTVLADRSFRVTELGRLVGDLSRRGGKQADTLEALLSVFLPFVNPPDHTASRRYLRAVLTARSVASYADDIRGIADDLLAAAPAQGGFDGATQFADLLPPLFMGRFLGLLGQMVVDFILGAAEMGKAFDRGCSPRYYARMNELISDMRRPFQQAVDERRREPRDDGLSRMMALAGPDHPLSDSALADHAMFITMAGSENTSALIGNAIAAVVEAGVDCDALAADDGFAEAAVAEALRFDGPVQQFWRFATRDMTLQGARIAAGERLLLLVGAANRDPQTFADPDSFNPRRANLRSIGLGAGMHYCLGAELASLEARICLQAIAARRPSFDPAHPRQWRDRQTLRRLAKLPLQLRQKDA